MELKLANGEVLIKEWSYSVTGGALQKDNKKLHTNLVLTNKRIINASESNLTIKRQEHAIEDIVGVEGAFMKNARGGPMFLKVISIIWCCTIIGALLGGIAGIKRANEKLRACVFYLVITTKGAIESPFAIGSYSESESLTRKRAFGNTINKTIVQVDQLMAKEIIDEIGALIINARNEEPEEN